MVRMDVQNWCSHPKSLDGTTIWYETCAEEEDVNTVCAMCNVHCALRFVFALNVSHIWRRPQMNICADIDTFLTFSWVWFEGQNFGGFSGIFLGMWGTNNHFLAIFSFTAALSSEMRELVGVTVLTKAPFGRCQNKKFGNWQLLTIGEIKVWEQ